jgi:hypothetical protein
MSSDKLDMAAIDKHVQEYTKQKRRGWFRRNWLWFVPLDLLLAIVVAGVVLYWAFYTRVYDLDLCQKAMLTISADPSMQQSLGDPIETISWPSRDTVPSARVEENEVDVIWNVEGSKARAKVHATSRKRQGKWDIVVLEVTMPDGKKKSLGAAGSGDDLPPPFNPGGQAANPGASNPKANRPETKGSDLNHDFVIPSGDGPPESKK